MIGALVLTGCASNVTVDQDAKEAAQTEFPDLSLPDLGAASQPIRGTPTEVYTRIARGAVTCWFGAHGPLKKSHIYHAIAKPPSQGGKARILIHKRDNKMRDKRGARAFAIDIVPTGKSAKLEIQNALMGEPRGTDMAKDARRWASGNAGCTPEPVAVGWDPRDTAKARAKEAKKLTRANGR